MYYIEKNIGDTWYFRTIPDGPWHEFTISMYKKKLSDLRKQIEQFYNAEFCGMERSC